MPNNRKPIIVSNPNDPRLQAYKDSLDFYSFNKRALDKILKTNKSSLGSSVDVSKKRYLTREQDINEAYNRYKSLGLNITKKDVSDEFDTFDKTESGKFIRKIGVYNFPITGGGIFRLAQYKKPEQPYIYKKVEEEKEKKPIITTNKRKVQAYNDSSFIKKNFNIFPKPKGYDQALKRVGQDPSSDYFPAPQQPYIYKKPIVDTRVKTNVEPLTIKPPSLNINTDIPERTPKPIVTPKKLPGGSGKFAQYPNMKKQLDNLKTSRMVNSKKVENIVPTFKEGVNLVAGGEKHRVYVKKSPTGVGKGVKGHVMVNHPTEDKGKWDTIDLTEKAGAKTVEDGKAATRKWHAENPYKMQKGNKSLKSAKPSYKDYLKTVNPDFLGPDYNLEEAYKNLPYETMRAWAKDPNRNHLPDTYKLPNHPTFSNESMYYKPGMKAGKWEGDKYIPIGDTLKKLSGAKSVKQYRGDENLPEAKKGMKKNCGCKHTRSKYKYQDGERDLLADKIEGIVPKRIVEENENLDYSINYDLPKSLKSRIEKIKNSNIIPVKNTVTPRVIRKDTVSVKKDSVSRTQKKTYPTVSGEKKIIIEKAPVSKVKNTSKSIDRATEYFNNYAGGDMIPGKKYQIVDGKMVIIDNPRQVWNKNGYKWEDLTEGEKNKVINLQKQERRNALQREVDIMNKSMKYRKPTYGDSEGLFARTQKAREIKNIQENVKRITSAVEGKSPYKYGTGALTIPEGSAIVTANGGKNMQALEAYEERDFPRLNRIINKMPEDNVSKKQGGTNYALGNPLSVSDAIKKNVKPGFHPTTVQDPAADYPTTRTPSKQREMELEYEKDPVAFKKKYGKIAASLQKERMQAVANKQEEFIWSRDKKPYKSGFTIEKKEDSKSNVPMRTATETTPTTTTTTKPESDKKGDDKKENRSGANLLANIPSLAEIAARSSILGRGIEYSNIPENYLKLGRYKYASQLPTTLREISQAEKEARETSRNVLGGDAGRYLAQAGNLSAARMERAAKEITDNTIKRQDILNKNVDLGNVEAQTNRALRDQYAAMRNEDRLKARAAYDEQLLKLGQRVDSATENAQEMANQKAMDEQRLQILKDLGVNYDIKDIDGLLKLVPKTTAQTSTSTPVTTPSFGPLSGGYVSAGKSKNGLKKVKAYKRR